MKTSIASNLRPLLRALFAFVIGFAALWVIPGSARQWDMNRIRAMSDGFISQDDVGKPSEERERSDGHRCARLYVAQNLGPSSVGEYNATTGKAINANFITGLTGFAPRGLALQGNTLFVSTPNSFTVSKYDATTGAVINANFIRGVNLPRGLAVKGNILFVANQSGSVGKYDATTGAAISPSFITGTQFFPIGLAVKGNILFVANQSGFVGKYDATTGEAINTSFITGLAIVEELALQGDILFVSTRLSSRGGGRVGKYDASTGETINASFITTGNPTGGLAVLGNTLFVAVLGLGRVDEYDATTGEAINTGFITGLGIVEELLVKSAK